MRWWWKIRTPPADTLGEKMENIGTGEYDQYATVRQVKELFRTEYGADVPVIAAGGIWDRADLEHALAEGADGVQMASRFVCTEECDADEAFKQKYIECTPEDIGLIMSPAGLPGRAILTNQDNIRQYDLDNATFCSLGCLKKCSYKESGERFCIVTALGSRPTGGCRERAGLLRHQCLEGRENYHRAGHL